MIQILRLRVRDYEAWKPVFDEHMGLRSGYGCLRHTIYRAARSPNDLTIVLEFVSHARSEEFSRSRPLSEAMGRAGIVGTPEWVLVERVEDVAYGEPEAA